MDILWGGTPMLTLAGETLASRVSSSLVVTMGFPELMCTNMAEYEEKAVHLATNVSELRELQAKVRAARATSPLFNTRLRVRHLEAAFLAMTKRWLEGLPPAHMNIGEAMKRTPPSLASTRSSSPFKRTRTPSEPSAASSMNWS
jgi:protein O-GlcNAc transferase